MPAPQNPPSPRFPPNRLREARTSPRGCCFLLSSELLSLEFLNSWGSEEVEETLCIWGLSGDGATESG